MKYFITIVFLTFTMISIGQEKHSFISLQSGVSIPVGKYSAYNLDESCFTTTGLNFNIEGAWFFKSWLGVGAQVGASFHPVDVSVLGYAKVLADPFVSDMSIRSDSYQMGTGTIGLFGRWDFLKNFSLQGKFLGGLMWGKTPYQLYKPEYFLVEPKWYEITPSQDYSFALTTGLAVQYDLSGCIGLKAGADYTFSKMEFGYTTATGIRYDKRDIGFINVDLAVVIHL